MISLQDRSLIVTYIQSYLKDYSGVNLVRSSQRYKRASSDSYEISQNKTIRVSGTYTEETYTAIAIFMAYNYPNEQFPERWDLRSSDSKEWIKTPFNQEKLVSTMNMLIESKFINEVGYEIDEEEYNSFVKDRNKYLSWDEIVRYFDTPLNLYDVLYDKEFNSDEKEFTQDDVNDCLVRFLVHNLESVPYQPRVAEISDRVVSYFLDEVVTSASDPDEIMRVQKIMYPLGLTSRKVGKFFDKEVDSLGNTIRNSMERDIKDAQQGFINRYTSSGVFTPPEGFKDFKVTGYVDPWTEWILKGGIE